MTELGSSVLCIVVVIALIVASNWGGYYKGYSTGLSDGVRQEQDRAIGAAVGRWTIDPESGEKQFVYGASK